MGIWARMAEKRNSYNILVKKLEWKRIVGIPRRRWCKERNHLKYLRVDYRILLKRILKI